MKARWILVAAAAATFASVSPARAQTAQEAARAVVEARGFVSLEPVPRGRTFELAVVARIRPAYHINAHKVLQDYLIPTEVQARFPPGLRLLATDYPAGEQRAFSFSREKLAVYTGQVVVRMKIHADGEAPLGALDLPLSLRYQACNDSLCLPPVEIPVAVHLTVAGAGTPSRAVHSGIFHR